MLDILKGDNYTSLVDLNLDIRLFLLLSNIVF